MILLLLIEDQLEDSEGDGEHDGAGEEDAADDGSHRLFEVEVEKGSGEGAGPDAGAWDRDADEEEEAEIYAVAAAFHELFAGFFAFCETEIAELIDWLYDELIEGFAKGRE